MAIRGDLAELGRALLRGEEPSAVPLPFQPWRDFDLRFAVEYPAWRFEEEIGFWSAVMGLHFLSLDASYVICTDRAHSFTFAFKPAEQARDLSFLRLQWFTDGLNEVIAALDARSAGYELIHHSANQRFLRFTTPSGLPVEIWSGYEPG